ncbi:cytochrome P450 [Streptomyces sp. G-5]|uniref:cytochrome P450 n=1 Tax=Streptomyces sp. G-5 TaxID=2977231 RepID=UPI0021D14C46|nr:cytochrome P450 [Streptomyces sp. G-5]MCU4750247.1 cytochrome P450 [Streptomyces sp. G-5]
MGPIAPVEIAPGVEGMVTTTYQAALHLLRNTPTQFAKDPRGNWAAWEQGRIAPDSPALAMMRPRNNALWMDGAPHTRLRGAITDSLSKINSHHLADAVEQITDQLIDRFSSGGRADLIADFADPLPVHALAWLAGAPDELGEEIAHCLARLFDTAEDAAAANQQLEAACLRLVRLRRRQPGTDATSYLLAHPARLTDEEMAQTILLLIGAGTTPATNLIGNALKLLISEDAFAGSVESGAVAIADVLDHVLWEDPPVSNYSPLYPRHLMVYDGIALQPGVPILVSFAAANAELATSHSANSLIGNRAHLAFSAGAHACPVPGLARVLAETAIERLLDRLPGITISGPTHRRPGTFTSGWATLPTRFPPAPTVHFGGTA